VTQPLENLISGDKLDFVSLDLRQTTLDLDPPRLFDINVRRTVERFEKRESELGSLQLGKLAPANTTA